MMIAAAMMIVIAAVMINVIASNLHVLLAAKMDVLTLILSKTTASQAAPTAVKILNLISSKRKTKTDSVFSVKIKAPCICVGLFIIIFNDIYVVFVDTMLTNVI